MDVVKRAFKCSDCGNILVRPVPLPCGDTVCLAHVQNLDKRIYSCPACFSNHLIDAKSIRVNKAPELMLESNIENVNLGDGYRLAFESCCELDRVIDEMKTLRRDCSYFINDKITSLKYKTELLREDYKLKIDTMADEIVQKLDSYERECNNYLRTKDFKARSIVLDENLNSQVDRMAKNTGQFCLKRTRMDQHTRKKSGIMYDAKE